VAAVTKLDGKVEITSEMAPGGDGLRLAAELIRAGRKRVMVVGHEPDLSMLVMRLLGQPPALGMQKAMVVGAKLTLVPDAQDEGHVSATKRFILDPKTLAWDRS
jgi:phosphohistidine phosphatase SixA